MQQKATILACLFVCVNCFSQQYPFVHYTPKDGLVNSRVKKAYQDSKGRMYFMTFGGLSVYDGARFKNYTSQDGLASNLVNDILEVGDDSLLLATNSGHFVNVLVKGRIGNLNSKSGCPVINQFYRHDDDKIYMASDYGLFMLENKTIRELKVLSANNHVALHNLRSITGIDNWLVISTSDMSEWQGIYLYDIKSKRITDSLAGYLIDKDKNKNIWVSSSNQLFIFDPTFLNKGKLSLISPPGNYQQVKQYSTALFSFGKKNTWFVYRSKETQSVEIRRIDENGNVFYVPLPARTVPSVITNIFVDRENTLWLTNDGEGVFKIVNSSLRVFSEAFGTSLQGYIDDAFYSNGSTWYSTTTDRLFRKSQDEVTEFICNMSSAPEIFYYDGEKILARDHNKIYEGTLNEQKRTIYFHKLISLAERDLFGRRLILDRNGNIITIQKSGLGVWKNNKLIFLLPPQTKVDIIDDLCFDKNNLLWVQNRFTGINVFSIHPEDHSNYLQPFYHFEPKQIMGAPRCFVIDKTGLIWIGTRENGLFAYKLEDGRLNQLYRFDISSGLTDNFVTSLACDSSNNIIVGTQTGLDRVLRSGENSLRIENSTKSINFFSLIYQVWADADNAYARCFSGALLQLSSSGQENIIYQPELLLEEIKVNTKTLSTLKKGFRYKENNLSFLVAAPSFIDENHVTYSYLLKGSGNDLWSDTSATNSVINLSNLSSGKYSLNVKAFFPSGIYPPSELSYSFEIEPPWWQTWWFRALAALLIIGVLVLVVRFYYKRRLEKQMTILEKKQAIEKERTRIATDMHDDLGAGLSKIKFLSETIGIKKQQQQPIEEDISKIREYSHEMIDKMGEIVWALNEKNDSLSDLLSYSRSYAVEYLSQSGIECNVEIPDNSPTFFVSGEFRRNVYLTLKEALHNIVKHARAGHVHITINVNHILAITIHDDGIGFDKNKIRPFSNGLSNMEKRMKDIGGSIEIKNNNGTSVELIAPLL